MMKFLRSLFIVSSVAASATGHAAAGKQDAKKLRILCLHGFHGSGSILQEQIAQLKSTLSPYAELVFVDTPTLAKNDFGWWHAIQTPDSKDLEDPGVDGGPNTQYKGWDVTRAFLVDTFAKKGPFDGVLGFSQGGALTGLTVGMRAGDGKPTPSHPLTFDFAIEFSGYVATDPKLIPLYEAKDSYNLPSLHVVGLSDMIVSPAHTQALASKFKNPIVIKHDGGHIIASTPEVKTAIKNFLVEAQKKKALNARGSMQMAAKAPEPLKAQVPILKGRTPLTLPLWSKGSAANMKVFFPKEARYGRMAAVVVFPGGAYSTPNGSGSDAAEWIAQQGMVGIKVQYATRGSNESHPQSYNDAARALRMVRSRATEFGIDPDRIALMGFSAGGHLAALVATQPDLIKSVDDDLLGKVSARPNLLILGYPLISFVDGYGPGAYAGSTDNFFGKRNADESQRKLVSSEWHVDGKTPPTFIWTTDDDYLVPSNHSKIFVAALKKAAVPVKFNLYPNGPHGLGLALSEKSDVKNWTKELLVWMDQIWKTN